MALGKSRETGRRSSKEEEAEGGEDIKDRLHDGNSQHRPDPINEGLSTADSEDEGTTEDDEDAAVVRVESEMNAKALDLVKQLVSLKRGHGRKGGLTLELDVMGDDGELKYNRIVFPNRHKTTSTNKDDELDLNGRKMTQYLLVVDNTHHRIVTDDKVNIRGAYYGDKFGFDDQQETMVVQRQVDAHFGIRPSDSTVVPGSSGLFFGGALLFIKEIEHPIRGDILALIPPTRSIERLEVKEECFLAQIIRIAKRLQQRLGPMISIGCQGSPSFNTRAFIYMLSKHPDVVKRKIPILLLFDGDPAGFTHMGSIKYNSPNGIRRRHINCETSDAIIMGLTSSDITRWISPHKREPLTARDMSKIHGQLERQQWSAEERRMLQDMHRSQVKASVQAINSSVDRNNDYGNGVEEGDTMTARSAAATDPKLKGKGKAVEVDGDSPMEKYITEKVLEHRNGHA
ncbi:hypothetical protein KEM48_009398 [Puccinia striiformis f. sp. tritici PST-130]|nr:hypothetical protein KEM48_009398 [Puccinia striiformis f. sp. tritici PST-130]